MTCSHCNTPITRLDSFPDNLCPTCYYSIMDAKPLEEIEKPDFIKALT